MTFHPERRDVMNAATNFRLAWGAWWPVLSLVFACAGSSALELPPVFGDHMVLQRDVETRVWGRADANAQVTVELGSARGAGTADAEGRFAVPVSPLPAGGPHTLTVTAGGQTIRYEDVLMGEVWLCSGQSNMERAILHTDNPARALPRLRMLKVPRGLADTPQDAFEGAWVTCDPKSARPISAVGYAFGEMLEEKLDVPVGIIHSAYGGSALHPWVRRTAMERVPEVKPFVSKYRVKREKLNKYDPQAHYNAMIAPLAPLRLGGVLWYQGESDASRGQNYRYLLRALMADWRDAFANPELPFGVIQLSSYEHPGHRDKGPVSWLAVRESQALVADEDPHAGLIVTHDVGERYDIHPNDKRTVGRRAAAWALDTVYDQPTAWTGPRFVSWKQEGEKLTITFNHVTGELLPRSGDKVFGFQAHYPDGAVRWGIGVARGDRVVIETIKPGVEHLRYAYENAPLDANLTDGSGLPARPFRTDTYPLPTDGEW